MLIDTHSHIYDSAFDADRDEALARCTEANVGLLLLPAIDEQSNEAMFELCRHRGDLVRPMMGLHPTSITTIAVGARSWPLSCATWHSRPMVSTALWLLA